MVAIETERKSRSVLAESDGSYEFTNVLIGNYFLRIGGAYSSEKQNISVLEGDTSFAEVLEFSINENTIEHDVYGELSNQLDSVQSISVPLSGDSITGIQVQDLSLNLNTKRFSGVIYLPNEGNNWKVEIKVYSTYQCRKETYLSGYSKVNFDKLTGDGAIPEFSSINYQPVAKGSISKTKLSVNDTLFLYSLAIDSGLNTNTRFE